MSRIGEKKFSAPVHLAKVGYLLDEKRPYISRATVA